MLVNEQKPSEAESTIRERVCFSAADRAIRGEAMGRQPCCEKIGLKRGAWTTEEDSKLIEFILGNGIQCWRLVPKLAGLMRCGKSCRLRWINYLRPDLKRGAFTEAEEEMIIQLHSRLGNRWSKIATHLPGRTDNEIKNHWNTKIKKKLKLLGFDPLTHKRIHHSSNQEEQKLDERLDHFQETTASPPDNNEDLCQIQMKTGEEGTSMCSIPHQLDKNDDQSNFVDAGMEMSPLVAMESPSENLIPVDPWINDPFLTDGFTPFGYCFPW